MFHVICESCARCARLIGLVKRSSAFLAIGGYKLENSELLLTHLREQAQNGEATLLEKTIYGQLYEVQGRITGPSGVPLDICSIWMTENLIDQTKFITLFPDKRPPKT